MSVLFKPVKIGNLEIKNRFIRSATYYALSDENGHISRQSVELMKTLAENDVGLIMTGFAYVLKSGQVGPDMNGIQDDDHIPAYKEMTKAVHEAGGRIAMQIVHGGAGALGAAQTGDNYMAVSLVDDLPEFGREPREMEEEDIQEIIEAFGNAARRAQEAGFDGVQIHGAHGYLVSQFLSPRTNQRSDRWGGSPEKRMRFVIEVTRSVKRHVDEDFPVMVKLGARDYLQPGDQVVWGRSRGGAPKSDKTDSSNKEVGLTIEEGAEVARVLENEGVSFVEISCGFIGTSSYKIHVGITSPEQEAYFLQDARVIRQKTSGPLGLVAGLRSIPVMEEIVNSGVVECIALCRPLIREPGLVRRWKNGDTRPAECISCGGCFNLDENGKMHIYCSQVKKN